MVGLNNSFSQIAHVYARFNNEAVYQNWLAFTLKQLETFPERHLDLACGTGVFTRLMRQFTQDTIAIDYDPKMIEQAQLMNDNQAIDYRTLDMQDISALEGQFDLVTCYLDSLCFLTDQRQLQTVFQNVYDKLADKGQFIFDVWTLNQLISMDGYYYFEEDASAALLWDTQLIDNQEPVQVVHKLTVFERNSQETYDRIAVQLHERTYRLETYRRMLIEAGFKDENIKFFADFGEHEISHESVDDAIERWFIKAIK